MASTDYNQLTGSDLTDMRACVFPIQRLCPDILAEIFTFCLPEDPDKPKKVGRISSRNAPLLLCSVCSSWRSLAISTPRLWQTLHLRTSGSDDRLTTDIESTTSGIRTWLDRSRALPLSIRAKFWMEDFEADNATKCRLILEVLSQEISRWESFELYENGIWVTPPHFGNSPMLHTLDILVTTIHGIPFMAAPRLKRLSFYDLRCSNPTSELAVPWDQLVELSIEETQLISTVVGLIQRCPRLESLSLLVEEGDEDGSLTFRSTTQHDTLRRLHLNKLPYVNALTDHLTLPALTDLSLLSTPEVEPKIGSLQLLAFFTRSNCELREFALFRSEFGPGELLECLSHRSCQTLARLVIYGNGDSPSMVCSEPLIHLTYRDVDEKVPLCPKLSHLEMNDCYYADESPPDLLGRMIQSRCFGRDQDSQLRSFQIGNRYPVSMEDYELLQYAESNGGLELNYHHFFKSIPGGEDEDEEYLCSTDD